MTTPSTVIVLLALTTVIGSFGATRWRIVEAHGEVEGMQLSLLIGFIGAAVTIACALAVFLAANAGAGEREELERKLNYLTDHDPLTGLPNRRSFERTVERHIVLSRRYEHGGAVLIVDLDRLKDINEELGREAGDSLISDVAEAMRDRLRDSDYVARIGGDEFAVLLPSTDRDGAIAAADSVLEAIRNETVTLRETGVSRVTASVGVACLEDITPLTAAMLIGAADHAMADAKSSGRDALAVFDGDHRRDGSTLP
ncbi:MAG TPA: GGDEF domain-containing protein [Solirubrobacterales bacterium]|nr:GGDEF domain-containing protein [Solirubrobacterales bacterium]